MTCSLNTEENQEGVGGGAPQMLPLVPHSGLGDPRVLAEGADPTTAQGRGASGMCPRPCHSLTPGLRGGEVVATAEGFVPGTDDHSLEAREALSAPHF